MAWRIPWTVVRGVSQNRTQLNNFHFHWDSLVQIVKSLQCGRPGFNPWVGKIPWRRNWQPTPVLLPRKFQGWRSLVGYSPWGHKELDTTEQLHWFVTSSQPGPRQPHLQPLFPPRFPRQCAFVLLRSYLCPASRVCASYFPGMFAD